MECFKTQRLRKLLAWRRFDELLQRRVTMIGLFERNLLLVQYTKEERLALPKDLSFEGFKVVI